MKNRKWKRLLALILCGLTAVQISTVQVQAEEEYWPQEPDIPTPSAIVMEMNTGAILYEKNADEIHYPASITKIMTTLVALENSKLDEVVTFSADAVYKNEGDTSHIARDVDEQMTMEQCLYGVMLESANECAYAVAEHVGGDETSFVSMMNQKAQELGCKNTHFHNTNGLPDEEHYTTARDMALIAQAAYKNENFRIITGTGRYVIPPTNKHAEETILQNHHSMLYPLRTSKYLYDGCTGGKTGYTDAANSTLVTYAERDGMSLVCVVMYTQSPNHFVDTATLLDYCFDNFQVLSIQDNETEYTDEKLNKSESLQTKDAFVSIDKSGGIVLPKGIGFESAKAKVNTENVTDKTAGRLEYTYAGHLVGGADIIITGEKPETFPFDNVTEGKSGKTFFIHGSFFAIVAVIAVVLLIGFVVVKYISGNFQLRRYWNRGRREKPDRRYKTIRDTRKYKRRTKYPKWNPKKRR